MCPTFKKHKKYRLKNKKTSVDVIPIEDREVSIEIYSRYVEIKDDDSTKELKDK